MELKNFIEIIDVEGLLEYIRENFPNPLENHFTYDLVKNVLNLANSFSYPTLFLEKMIPEITEEEISRFSTVYHN